MKEFVHLVHRFSTREGKRINKICEPLKLFGITSFWQSTMSLDGHYTLIISEGEAGEYFAENELFKGHPNFRHPELMTWAIEFPDLLYGLDEKYRSTQGAIRDKFQLDQVLHLRERIGNTTHIYGFTSTPNMIGIKEFYLNYTHLIWKFIKYFKEETEDIRKKVDDNKIHIAAHCGEDFYRELITDKAEVKLEKINRFLAMIGEFDQQIDHLPEFTPREQDCIHCYLQGLSTRQLANKLGISKRTGEHYLENVKSKLHCSNRAELFERLQLLQSLHILR